MVLRLFLVLLFTIFSYAQELLEIPKSDINLKSDGHIYIIKEDESHNTSEKILKSDKLTILKNSYLGIRQGPFWTRLDIKNSSTYHELLVYSPHPGANVIDVYVYRNNILSGHHILGDLNSQDKREIISRFSLFKLKLSPNENVTIVSKIENYGMYRVGWIIQDYENFNKVEKNTDLLYGLLGGLALFYLFYTIQEYFKSKKLGYLFIGVDVLFITIYMYAVYGILYKINIGIPLGLITFLAFIAIYIATLARIIFVYYFFNLNKKYTYLAWIIIALFFIAFLTMLNVLYAFYYDLSTIVYLKYHFYYYIIYPFIIFLISIYLWFKKEQGSGYFILTEIFHIAFSTVNVLTIFGVYKYNWYSPYLLNFAMLIDAVLLLLLQYYRDKKEKEASLKEKQMLLEQARFFSIGQTIGNITHQWKAPLSYLGSTVTKIEAFSKRKDFDINEIIKESIPIMQNNIKFMRNTLQDFDVFYKTKPQKEIYNPYLVIEENILPLVKTKCILKNATINLDISKSLSIVGYDYHFSNILLVLINNSLDAFDENKNTNKILIKIEKSNSDVKIELSDNAGGIKIKPIEKIFEYFVSSKNSQISGHGIGLAMVKVLIQEQLKGSIHATNNKEGSVFIIVFDEKLIR